MLYWRFHFNNKILVKCLLIEWKCTNILDFGVWRWSALNMCFVDKRPSRTRGQIIFWSRVEHTTIFGWYENKNLLLLSVGLHAVAGTWAPTPTQTCMEVCRGRFNVAPSTSSPSPHMTLTFAVLALTRSLLTASSH